MELSFVVLSRICNNMGRLYSNKTLGVGVNHLHVYAIDYNSPDLSCSLLFVVVNVCMMHDSFPNTILRHNVSWCSPRSSRRVNPKSITSPTYCSILRGSFQHVSLCASVRTISTRSYTAEVTHHWLVYDINLNDNR